MTSRYCVTCKKTIRGRAIGAHIQHKHTVRETSPYSEEAAKKARAGIAALKKKFMDKVSPITGMSGLENTPATTEAIDKTKAAEAAHAERMLVLHEKTLDVILALSKDPQLATTVGPLLAVLTDAAKKFPLWLLTAVAGITPTALYATNLLGGK